MVHRLQFLTLVLACLGRSAVVEVPATDPSIHALGRWATESGSGDVRWSWSGSGAMATFSGTACSIHLLARGALYDVYVDGRRTDSLDLSTSSDTLFRLAQGLAQGVHTVGVRVRTEASYSIARFRGFRIDGTPRTAAPGSDRRIEFYGNSITCGYGILDSLKEHGFDVHTENEARTYAALASDSLGAERRTICWSGRGVIQNYRGDVTSPTLPALYDRGGVATDDAVVWDFSKWAPQVVAIDLGTNDYSTVVPDSAKFHRTYTAFVDSLHAKYPAARFVLLDGPMMSPGSDACNKLRKNLDDVVSDAVKHGIAATHLTLSPQDGSLGYGADWHPSLRQAVLNGKELAAYLKTLMGWGPSAVGPLSVRANSPGRSGLVVRTVDGHLATGVWRDGEFLPVSPMGRGR